MSNCWLLWKEVDQQRMDGLGVWAAEPHGGGDSRDDQWAIDDRHARRVAPWLGEPPKMHGGACEPVVTELV